MAALTRRQRQVYEFIRESIQRNGYAPSFEEIGQRLGMASMATVHKHMKALEARGAVRREPNRSRAVELTGAADFVPAYRVPLLGQVAAGAPIEAIADAQEVSLPGDFIGKNRTFVLRVRGDSMIDEQIRDGDLIIVERRRTADDGQTVVALIDGAEATVKKLFREGGKARLQPANERMKPMIYDWDRVEVQGVVIGLMRKYGK